MKIKSQRDFWAGMMFLLLGLGFARGAMSYSFGASAQPGPGYFPFGLGVLLALLGAVELFKALTLESEGGDPIGPIAWRPLLTVAGAVAAFGYALPLLGLFVALPLLVLLVSLAGDEHHWVEALVSAAVLTAGSWFVFVYLLKLAIPLKPALFGLGG